jgi:RsiW-degrading membrane proteinase PrsW (M82 family)
MESKRIRRESGTGIGFVPFFVYIDASAKAKMDRFADAAEISLSRAIEAVISHMPEAVHIGAYGDSTKYKHQHRTGDTILKGVVSPAAKAKVLRLAKLNGGKTSMAQVMNVFIPTIQLDPYGLPDWWTDPAAPIYQEALPITGT